MNVLSIGHRAVARLLFQECLVEEKLDGTPVAFGRLAEKAGEEPQLQIKGRLTDLTEGYLRSIEFNLKPGYLYIGEFLPEPQGRVLTYERTPANHIMILDVITENGGLLGHEEKFMEADSLGFECVPLLYQGRIESAEQLRAYLDLTSCLGGETIEGVVIKPIKPVLDRRTKTPIYAKFVNPEYLLRRQFSGNTMEAMMMMAQLQGEDR